VLGLEGPVILRIVADGFLVQLLERQLLDDEQLLPTLLVGAEELGLATLHLFACVVLLLNSFLGRRGAFPLPRVAASDGMGS